MQHLQTRILFQASFKEEWLEQLEQVQVQVQLFTKVLLVCPDYQSMEHLLMAFEMALLMEA